MLFVFVVFWNSDTLDAIVKSAMLNDTIENWIISSELPQNINIHGDNVANLCLGCVFHTRRRTKYFLFSCNEELEDI